MTTKDFLEKHDIYTLFKHEKSLGYLLMNGFSYWEAVRIANEDL